MAKIQLYSLKKTIHISLINSREYHGFFIFKQDKKGKIFTVKIQHHAVILKFRIQTERGRFLFSACCRSQQEQFAAMYLRTECRQ